ncbi:MAG: HAD family hydrolase [Bdellovibrionales bacterium]|nr:HAD family hydrolase [Bdellovibrionales bacterium]
MKKVVFLDRDGTLIIDKIYLNDPEDIVYLPGVFEGMQSLRDQGFEFIVVTNQSGIPRGLVQEENLLQIHKNMSKEFAKHGIEILQYYYAPHLVESNHPLRKPNPGMIEAGCEEFSIDRNQSWMVGDRMTDVEAGHRAGMKSIFLHGSEDPNVSKYDPPEGMADTFLEVVDLIVSWQDK